MSKIKKLKHMLCLKVVKVMSNPSARELTDALLRTSKKSSLKQNIASVMKERASTLASNIVSVKKVKRAESIIRCIPGSYINGHWKQLDGFFGAYFNEETIEISLIPPPLELK